MVDRGRLEELSKMVGGYRAPIEKSYDLPIDFTPRKLDVICSRGSGYLTHGKKIQNRLRGPKARSDTRYSTSNTS